MKKKWLIRATLLLGVCVAALLIAAPAMAMFDWCEVDPTLSIGGHNVNLELSIQGDLQQVRGNIVFTVSVPRGTQVSDITCDPNTKVNIKYIKSKAGYANNRGIPVDVSVDINTRTAFNTRLIVSVDGNQAAQDQGTTRGDLDCNFTIR